MADTDKPGGATHGNGSAASKTRKAEERNPVGVVGNAAISNITDTSELLRYAAKAHLSVLREGSGGMKVTHKEAAEAMGIAGSDLAAALNGTRPIENILDKLDAAVFAYFPEMGRRTGGLVALAARLEGQRHEDNAVAGIPSTWVTELLQKHFEQPVGILIQASALLSSLLGAQSQSASDAVCRHHERDLVKVVEPLLFLGVGAPTPHSVEALIVLGGLARHRGAFEAMKDTIEQALTDSPLGFRVWRVITSIVRAGRAGKLPSDHLRKWVENRLESSASLRQTSLYPARSLDLELAISVPASWTAGGSRDWAVAVLRDRAADPTATIRERSTAAMGLWERAFNHPEGEAREQAKMAARLFLRTLAETLRADIAAAQNESSYHAVPGGAEWLVVNLEHALTHNEAVVNTWPVGDLPMRAAVAAGAQHLLDNPQIPSYLKDATRVLFEHALLQNAGVWRRKAIDTLRSAGVARPVAAAMRAVMEHPDAEPWLRCRVAFAIGFLQDRGDEVEQALKTAFQEARENLERNLRQNTLTRDLVSELHAILFAIGDCFGALGAEAAARRMRRFLHEQRLWTLVDQCGTADLAPIARAAAYLLTVTTQSDDRLKLEELSVNHLDEPTRAACEWALARRFAGNQLRPLHLITH